MLVMVIDRPIEDLPARYKKILNRVVKQVPEEDYRYFKFDPEQTKAIFNENFLILDISDLDIPTIAHRITGSKYLIVEYKGGELLGTTTGMYKQLLGVSTFTQTVSNYIEEGKVMVEL